MLTAAAMISPSVTDVQVEMLLLLKAQTTMSMEAIVKAVNIGSDQSIEKTSTVLRFHANTTKITTAMKREGSTIRAVAYPSTTVAMSMTTFSDVTATSVGRPTVRRAARAIDRPGGKVAR